MAPVWKTRMVQQRYANRKAIEAILFDIIDDIQRQKRKPSRRKPKSRKTKRLSTWQPLPQYVELDPRDVADIAAWNASRLTH